ncbi:3'(2'),5'-bisphosphate nucleotidase CysQ [Roseomonas sp. PWR1]|uniref:3'(2'),5'-bisphosphate nucleotidase CysQ n=1 Tax=Roseomonas nitratireducens TaxID=2820810 RepID=A0ABS4AVT4_9PROT|nr:3'(2'),5'-bisphosphate nucleotidase CysQ [Neoroseomonas nitratireducens]MBP0465485.1 3'(2'),5'-bisphosphate nucleotidase CysQ [Neoroseomonas nitratireducens]
MGFSPGERAALADAFTSAAEAAAAGILSVYGVADSRPKADGSPLTEADLAAHDAIVAALAQRCPGIAVVSEEDAAATAVPPGAAFILVDPLDGTREFLSRNGEFTVNIALVEAGRPVAGVVLAPALGCAWLGVLGAGARKRGPGSAPWRPISVRRPDPAGIVAVASRSHRDAATDAFLAAHGVAGLRAVGSSLKFCLVAEGEADVYPRFGPTMEWDTAAGQAVLEAAGGSVLAAEGGPFAYGKEGWRNGPFIAWGAPPAA